VEGKFRNKGWEGRRGTKDGREVKELGGGRKSKELETKEKPRA
jgi:hypothetical protein